jgi:uncharacterized SAM-binding protein YcdF (DUF218 family)
MSVKRILKAILPWVIPILLVWCGIGFLTFVPGYRFSAFLCFAAAGVWSVYILLGRWQKKREKPARILRRILTICLVLGLLVSSVTLGFIMSGSDGNPEQEESYIIILGAGVHGTTPSLILSQRIRAAYDYLMTHPETICIVSGGQGTGENISEAACMFRELTSRGIAAERIWQEDQSTSTWENLKFSLALIEEKTGDRPESLGVVSNEFHLFRAGLQAKKQGITITGIPAKTGWVSLRVNYFLREIAAVWKYLIFGGN